MKYSWEPTQNFKCTSPTIKLVTVGMVFVVVSISQQVTLLTAII